MTLHANLGAPAANYDYRGITEGFIIFSRLINTIQQREYSAVLVDIVRHL